jgi:hypothetical protein
VVKTLQLDISGHADETLLGNQRITIQTQCNYEKTNEKRKWQRNTPHSD